MTKKKSTKRRVTKKKVLKVVEEKPVVDVLAFLEDDVIEQSVRVRRIKEQNA